MILGHWDLRFVRDLELVICDLHTGHSGTTGQLGYVMKPEGQKPTTRREWITRCARGSVLAGLAALAVRVLVRAPGASCRHPANRCRDCELLAQCEAERTGRG